MAASQKRERARGLRRHGESISVISKKTQTSKSTVSYWCRDIVLTSKQIKYLSLVQKKAGAVGRLRAAEKKRAQRLSAIETESLRGARSVGPLSKRDLYMIGIALYWGEGYKKGNEECGLTNSDPDIIRVFLYWLQLAYHIPKSDLVLRVSINHAHRLRIRKVEQYWSRITGISLYQFTKPSLIKTPSQKTYSNFSNHFGTLRVKVRRATALRRRILGSIKEVARQAQAM